MAVMLPCLHLPLSKQTKLTLLSRLPACICPRVWGRVNTLVTLHLPPVLILPCFLASLMSIPTSTSPCMVHAACWCVDQAQPPGSPLPLL